MSKNNLPNNLFGGSGRGLLTSEEVPADFFYCTREVLEALLIGCKELSPEGCEKFASGLCQRTFLNKGKPLTAEDITIMANKLPPLPDEGENE